MEIIEQIESNKVYKQVLADSFGGVMYNVANAGKYDAEEIKALWESMTDGEKSVAGGIMKGAMSFLNERGY
jgi:hypothetical protein